MEFKKNKESNITTDEWIEDARKKDKNRLGEDNKCDKTDEEIIMLLTNCSYEDAFFTLLNNDGDLPYTVECLLWETHPNDDGVIFQDYIEIIGSIYATSCFDSNYYRILFNNFIRDTRPIDDIIMDIRKSRKYSDRRNYYPIVL